MQPAAKSINSDRNWSRILGIDIAHLNVIFSTCRSLIFCFLFLVNVYLVHKVDSILFVDICTTLINKKPTCRLTNGIIDVNNRIQLAKQNGGKQTRHLIGVSSAHTQYSSNYFASQVPSHGTRNSSLSLFLSALLYRLTRLE
jgi:hypothetical protein